MYWALDGAHSISASPEFSVHCGGQRGGKPLGLMCLGQVPGQGRSMRSVEGEPGVGLNELPQGWRVCVKTSEVVLWVPSKKTLKYEPQVSECDLIWKQSLYRGNQSKMRSLGWTLIHGLVSLSTGEMPTQRHTYREGAA